jgi:hypothetical protein
MLSELTISKDLNSSKAVSNSTEVVQWEYHHRAPTPRLRARQRDTDMLTRQGRAAAIHATAHATKLYQPTSNTSN